ncbi:MAG: hypothetical protein KDK78_01885 [Chlamydiia bacterium]|nr:hypothetical protein [Chlamydiia bacterium]
MTSTAALTQATNELIDLYTQWDTTKSPFQKRSVELAFGATTLRLDLDKTVPQTFADHGIPVFHKSVLYEIGGREYYYAKFSIANCGIDDYETFTNQILKRIPGQAICVAEKVRSYYDGVQPRSMIATADTTIKDVWADERHFDKIFVPKGGVIANTDRQVILNRVLVCDSLAAASLEAVKDYYDSDEEGYLKIGRKFSTFLESAYPKRPIPEKELEDQYTRLKTGDVAALDLVLDPHAFIRSQRGVERNALAHRAFH